MNEFRTQYDRQRFFTEPGTREEVVFSAVYADDGTYEIRPSGKVDLYGEIQSHRNSCDINYIVERYALGDTSALDKRQGLFFDAVGVPNNIVDYMNLYKSLEVRFAQMPAEERAKFGNDFGRFLAEYTFSTDSVSSPASSVSQQITPQKKDGEGE